ncbi:MAG: TraR/DksA family transcriptional regulator [Bdellovibrionota bacterium]
MDKVKLEKFKKLLLEHRTRILNRSMARGTEAFRLSTDDLVDENDHAAAVVQQGLTLEVQERDRQLLIEVDRALMKVENQSYGFCEDTEEPIDEARLEAQPWTRYCVEAAERREFRKKKFAIK